MAERFHYVWQCVTSAEVRGKRHTYKDKSCGVYNAYSGKKEITEEHRPQAAPCWWCTKRQRLTPSNTEYFFTKEDAIRTAQARNAQIVTEQFAEYSTEHSTEEA